MRLILICFLISLPILATAKDKDTLTFSSKKYYFKATLETFRDNNRVRRCKLEIYRFIKQGDTRTPKHRPQFKPPIVFKTVFSKQCGRVKFYKNPEDQKTGQYLHTFEIRTTFFNARHSIVFPSRIYTFNDGDGFYQYDLPSYNKWLESSELTAAVITDNELMLGLNHFHKSCRYRKGCRPSAENPITAEVMTLTSSGLLKKQVSENHKVMGLELDTNQLPFAKIQSCVLNDHGDYYEYDDNSFIDCAKEGESSL